MKNKVISVIEKYSLIDSGNRVIVALSGGADSVALLHILCSLKEKYNLTIYAAHLNHMIRGAEAERDEKHCKILCKKYNIELFVKQVDIPALSEQQKISEELCGRQERYSFFSELSARLDTLVATAHTASDNTETLLYNIARGTSLGGLCGIPPKRENIIRPLIECSREDIEAYCRDNSLEYITDSTNLEDEYTRNRIRHGAIPVLKAINPKLESAVASLSADIREADEYIMAQAGLALENCRSDYGYSCQELLKLPPVLLREAVYLLCEQSQAKGTERQHISLIADIIKNGGAVNLHGGVRAVSKQGILRFVKSTSLDKPCIEIKGNTQLEHNGREYIIEISDDNSISEIKADSEIKLLIGKAYLDKKLMFRTRQDGDKVHYKKRGLTKPLRRVMSESKIPSELRDELLLLAYEDKILWCEKLGVFH